MIQLSEEQADSLLRRLREASMDTPESSMASAPGSRNEALWTELVQLGCMTCRDETIDLPQGRQHVFKIFSLTPDGREAVAVLLSRLVDGGPDDSVPP
jgi:hypothetical protein